MGVFKRSASGSSPGSEYPRIEPLGTSYNQSMGTGMHSDVGVHSASPYAATLDDRHPATYMPEAASTAVAGLLLDNNIQQTTHRQPQAAPPAGQVLVAAPRIEAQPWVSSCCCSNKPVDC
jgi:hypothetical protein